MFLSHSSFPPCKSRSYNWVERLGRIPAPNKAEKNIWWKNMDPRWCKSMDVEYLLKNIPNPIWTDAHLIEMHGVAAPTYPTSLRLDVWRGGERCVGKTHLKFVMQSAGNTTLQHQRHPSTPNGGFILQLSPLFWSNFYLKGSLQKWGVRGNGFNESGTFGPWWTHQAAATRHQDFHLSLTGLGYGLGAKERWKRRRGGKKTDRICRFFFANDYG